VKNKLSYFIFNKPSDYERGHLENLGCNESGITATGVNAGGRGRFLSRVLDSYQDDMNWHRLHFEVNGNSAGAYKLTVYATNALQFERDGVLYRVDELVRSSKYSFDEKIDLLEPFIQKQIVGLRDILLHEVVGRYLWIVLEMYPQGNEEISISNITVYLPSRSWLEYLPSIYQRADLKSGFLERYLGIFQTLYEDLNSNIRNVADHFDADCCDEEFLYWLSGWLDLSDSYLWSEDKLRRLLSRSMELYLERGTRKSIEDIVEIYTGVKPFIVETFQLEQFKDQEEYETALLPMYGDNPLCFTVLVKEEYVKSVQEIDILLKIIEEMKPVQMEVKLVILKPYIFLNQYSFLGINSVLGQYRDLSLDGSTLFNLAVITNREGEAGK
jgi:phage tail-like protein